MTDTYTRAEVRELIATAKREAYTEASQMVKRLRDDIYAELRYRKVIPAPRPEPTESERRWREERSYQASRDAAADWSKGW